MTGTMESERAKKRKIFSGEEERQVCRNFYFTFQFKSIKKNVQAFTIIFNLKVLNVKCKTFYFSFQLKTIKSKCKSVYLKV